MTLDEDTQADLARQLAANPAPGSVVWLAAPPRTLNVHLLPDPVGPGGEPPSDSLLAARAALRPFSMFREDDEPIVIPLPAVSTTASKAVVTNNTGLRNKLKVKCPGVDLMFACTIWNSLEGPGSHPA